MKARGGCSGSEAVVVAASSSPCRRVPASARLGGNISVATFGPCRCVVTSSSRRVVAASSSPRHRRRRRRRVVARLYPHPPALTTSAGRRAVVSSVPASILSPSPSSAGRRRRSSPLVVVARRRRSSPRRREVSTNVSTSASTQVSTSVSTKRYPHRPPVLVVACHPSPPLSSPHPRGVSDCGSEAGAAATVSAWGCSGAAVSLVASSPPRRRRRRVVIRPRLYPRRYPHPSSPLRHRVVASSLPASILTGNLLQVVASCVVAVSSSLQPAKESFRSTMSLSSPVMSSIPSPQPCSPCHSRHWWQLPCGVMARGRESGRLPCMPSCCGS